MQGQNSDGTLQPPTGHESTPIPLEGLAKPQQMETKMLTMDEADLLRATRAFSNHDRDENNRWLYMAINNQAFAFSKFLIENIPAGKERSQALGNIHQTMMWAHASIGIEESKTI